MQTVTMAKFTRAFNKNWTGQAALEVIEPCGTLIAWITEYMHQEEKWKEFYRKLILMEQPCTKENVVH